MRAASFGAMFGAAALIAAFYYAILVGVAVLQYVGWWKVFVKAGQPGWKCLIPFYNGHVMYKLVWKPVYYWLTLVFALAVMVLVSVWTALTMDGNGPAAFTAVTWIIYFAYLIVALVWAVKFCVKLARCFGHSGAFAAGLVFLPVVFLLILAFGKDTYLGNPPAQPRPEPQDQEPWNV